MSVGTMFDWVARVFGFAFLLFMLYVLFFPSWREPPDDEDEQLTSWNAEAGRQTPLSEPTISAIQRPEQGHAKVVVFPVHRRTHG
jgi:hypothetical protein